MRNTLSDAARASLDRLESSGGASTPKKKRRRIGAKLSRAYARALDPAVTDATLAQELDIPVDVVSSWRKRRAGARARVELETMVAVDLGLGYHPELHATDGSIANSRWEPPQWILRTPMEYETFCRLAHFMMESGITSAEVAAGLGTRETDVLSAAEAWERVLIGPDGRICACGRSYVRSFEKGDLCRTCQTRGPL